MKIPVYTAKGTEKGSITVKKAFREPVRPDLVSKAFNAERSWLRQVYGKDPLAGKRTSAHFHGLRGARHSMQNREMSRMKRIHNQGFLNFTARFIPGSVKGVKAHGPKAEKKFGVKVNKKELLKAVLSAVAGSADKEIILSRGHKLNGVKHVPLVLEDGIQGIKKTKELVTALEALGLKEEMARLSKKKIRAGKGTMRGRKYRRKTGPLLVVKEDKGLARASANLTGIDTATLGELTIGLLAPGGHPGRLTVWTRSALEEFDKLVK
ncbi:MAG: 50S ribosomal protein L4 [Candidatus Aenigmatarchaeota archaeon]